MSNETPANLTYTWDFCRAQSCLHPIPLSEKWVTEEVRWDGPDLVLYEKGTCPTCGQEVWREQYRCRY